MAMPYYKIPPIGWLFSSIIIGCTEGEIRLTGGASYNEGRVETCLNGEWGTICDQMWNTTEAGVVCRQLQFASHSNGYKHVSSFINQLISQDQRH